jgi:RNA polymerase sigma factor (sigma-70 family)
MVQPCDDIPDFELIRRMADQKADFAGARDAWGHFYLRHNRFLLRVCMSYYGYMLDLNGARDLVHDTFLKAFDGAGTFDHGESCETALQGRKCRGWLFRIAENVVRDRFRGQPEVCLVDEGEVERLGGLADNADEAPEQVPESERLKLLESALSLLSDTEQTILRATMFWWQANLKHQRMPNDAMQQLSIQTGKSPENIRQIRLRALKKLEKHVNESLHNEKAD